MTNLTPAQLEQFESTFRYFDRDETNTLILSEFTAALASLGLVYTVRNTCHADYEALNKRAGRGLCLHLRSTRPRLWGSDL